MLAAFNMAGESTTATSTVTGSAPENASLLVIEHLRVDFPEVVAVNDLSLRIEAGDVRRISSPKASLSFCCARRTSSSSVSSALVDMWEINLLP